MIRIPRDLPSVPEQSLPHPDHGIGSQGNPEIRIPKRLPIFGFKQDHRSAAPAHMAPERPFRVQRTPDMGRMGIPLMGTDHKIRMGLSECRLDVPLAELFMALSPGTGGPGVEQGKPEVLQSIPELAAPLLPSRRIAPVTEGKNQDGGPALLLQPKRCTRHKALVVGMGETIRTLRGRKGSDAERGAGAWLAVEPPCMAR